VVNILLEGYDIDSTWFFDTLKEYIKPYFKVAVVAFSFRDNRVKSCADWNALYSKESGRFYSGIVSSFAAYGIQEENISFLNYFEDAQESAKNKVKSADIIYFLGGLPDRMMQRIKEFDLEDTLTQHKGVVMGYSAGAVIQFSEYYLSPDGDNPEFRYYKGLPYLHDFYMNVHYENTVAQNESIQRVLEEKKKPVYATAFMKGAIIIDNGKLLTLGDVKNFTIETARNLNQ